MVREMRLAIASPIDRFNKEMLFAFYIYFLSVSTCFCKCDVIIAFYNVFRMFSNPNTTIVLHSSLKQHL